MMSSRPPPMATYSPCRRCVRSTTAGTLSDRRGDGDQFVLAPGTLPRQAQIQAFELPAELAHGAQRLLRLVERRGAHDAAAGRVRARIGQLGRRRGGRDEQREPPGPPTRVVEVPLDLHGAGAL